MHGDDAISTKSWLQGVVMVGVESVEGVVMLLIRFITGVCAELGSEVFMP